MAAARSEIATVTSAHPAAVLRVPPPVVRAVATRAAEAVRVAAHLRSRADVPPPLDAAAARAALASFAALRTARARRVAVADDRHRLLALGNVAALVCLSAVALLLVTGVPPGSSVVAVLIALAAGGPVSALAVGTVRTAAATALVRRQASACSAALVEAGVETIGQLHARTFLLRAWSRRRAEAARAARVEERAVAAWHALVGDTVRPEQAEELLAAAARLRAAHLRLLALHLTHLAAAPADPNVDRAGPPPAAAERDDPTPGPPADGAPHGFPARPALMLVPAPPRPRPLLLWAFAGTDLRARVASLLRDQRHQ